MLDAPVVARRFDAYADPNVRAKRKPRTQTFQSLGALRQHLKLVLCRELHDVEHRDDVLVRYVAVEQVAHRVYEDALRLLPFERLHDALSSERQVEAALERVAGHAAEALRERLGVAVIAAGANLRAAGDGVPGRIRPFD